MSQRPFSSHPTVVPALPGALLPLLAARSCQRGRRDALPLHVRVPLLIRPRSSPWTPRLMAFARQAKALQASLLEIVDRVEIVKSEHEKLEGGNKFLQS